LRRPKLPTTKGGSAPEEEEEELESYYVLFSVTDHSFHYIQFLY
jgi:hypothetical protein